MRKRWSVAAPLTAFALLAVYLVATPATTLPLGSANGAYGNACCGPVMLRDGIMSFQKSEVAYVVERDKNGAYVLPRTYVGVLPGWGLQMAHDKNPMKLRLDDEERPRSITIIGTDKMYRFSR